jgi:O-antigen biosynthesis protein
MRVLLRPLNDLDGETAASRTAGRWRSLGEDPQLSLLADGDVLSPGWYRLDLRWRILDGRVEAPVLYPDHGSGFSEATVIRLGLSGRSGSHCEFVYFDATVHAVRFDPSARAVAFAIDELSLQPMTDAEAARDRFRWLLTNGHPAWRIWSRLRRESAGDTHRLAELLIRECRDIDMAPPKAKSHGVLRNVFGGIAAARAQGESWRTIAGNGLRSLGRDGVAGFRRRLDRFVSSPGMARGDGQSDYERWIAAGSGAGEPVPPTQRPGTFFSVIVPTYKPPLEFLSAALDSVLGQTHAGFELCIADDASDDAAVVAMLEDYAARDTRVRYVIRPERGGIAANTNSALELAAGDYVVFLDHDDLLHRDALASLAAAIDAGSAGDIVYSDHDCIGPDGRRRNPYFKPDWSPDLFLAQMYLGHFVAVRRELVERAGGLRPGCDGSQDYDLVLRCISLGARPSHIPKILYHWRQHPGSTAANPQSKPYAHDAGRRAIQSYLDEVSPGARAESGEFLFTYDVRYPLPSPQPRAAIVIPTRDRVDLLGPCLESLFAHTDYDHYDVIVVDNNSVEEATQDYLAGACRAHPNLRVLPAPISFNWSRLNNLGAADIDADVLVFLNNDTVVISRDWLLRLVENALRPEVGVCGPLLLYEDGTIQHAGVVIGLGGWADHVYKGEPPQHRQDLFVSPMLRRDVLAVTGACMAIATEKFRALSGFDEEFIICGSDVDLCLRAHHAGLRNVYLPETRLYHYESKTRDPRAIPEVDFVRSAASYGEFRTVGDPLYNSNLDPMRCTPSLRR